MSTSPAEHLMNILANVAPPIGAIGSATGWRLGCGRMLDEPDQQIILNDMPGERPSPKWLLDYPYIQALIRGSEDDWQGTRQKTQDVYDALLGILPITFVGGDHLDAITGAGNPSFIGSDQKNRPMFSANFRLIWEPAQAGYTNRQPL